jgi:hypothetical protein
MSDKREEEERRGDRDTSPTVGELRQPTMVWQPEFPTVMACARA